MGVGHIGRPNNQEFLKHGRRTPWPARIIKNNRERVRFSYWYSCMWFALYVYCVVCFVTFRHANFHGVNFLAKFVKKKMKGRILAATLFYTFRRACNIPYVWLALGYWRHMKSTLLAFCHVHDCMSFAFIDRAGVKTRLRRKLRTRVAFTWRHYQILVKWGYCLSVQKNGRL